MLRNQEIFCRRDEAGEMTGSLQCDNYLPLRTFSEQMETDVWVNRMGALNFTVFSCSSVMDGLQTS